METKHYTRAAFADSIVAALAEEPNLVVDPCCGGGALLDAARARWPNVAVVGVDRLSTACRAAAHLASLDTGSFFVGNALDSQVWKRIPRPDLMICNPPFGGASTLPADERVDVQFFRRCVSQLAANGTVAFVLPSALASAPRYRDLRREILSSFVLQKVLQLPPNAFLRTEARAVVLIGRRGSHSDVVEFLEIDSAARVTAVISGPIEGDTLRFDPHFYLSVARIPRVSVPTMALDQLVENVTRGYSLAQLRASAARNRYPLIRVGALPSLRMKLPAVTARHQKPNVGTRSLLMARVGRQAGTLNCLYEHDIMAVATDAVFVLRVRNGYEGYAALALQTQHVAAQLVAARRGMTAQHIGRKELLALRVPKLPPRVLRAISRDFFRRPMSRERLLRKFEDDTVCA